MIFLAFTRNEQNIQFKNIINREINLGTIKNIWLFAPIKLTRDQLKNNILITFVEFTNSISNYIQIQLKS